MDKAVLITGASSGFGLLTAVTLARRGWRVLATMRDLERRGKLEDAARAAGVLDCIEFLALDVTDNARIAALATEIGSRETPLDAIVNNAGFAMAGFCEDVSDSELRQQFDTNFFGAAAVTRAFLPQLRRRGSGHIVMISSISGRMGFPGVGTYSASKFAMEGWAETLRLEMKPLGVQIVLVEPGSFETDIWTRNAILAAGAKDANSPNAARTARLLKSREARKLKANPQRVADGIAAILDSPHPRLRYVFGRDAKLGLLLKCVLPSKLLERLLIGVSGIGE
ncbi:MAG: SDR family oxidoreductase [Terracidiphilus sp.]|jgi:NAD(P)-dependent dehydrogenase (short-subunit alcohol dehydrogenase family)